jgi:hypothetical protein
MELDFVLDLNPSLLRFASSFPLFQNSLSNKHPIHSTESFSLDKRRHRREEHWAKHNSDDDTSDNEALAIFRQTEELIIISVTL